MSRIGNRKIIIPEGVSVNLEDNIVTVKGKLGELSLKLPSVITMEINDNEITLKRSNELKFTKALHVTVKGKLGELSLELPKVISVEIEGNEITLKRSDDEKVTKSLHGTANANITNMIKGVTEGYKKDLEIIGVGYRFNMKGNNLVISAGYSHPVEMEVPNGIKLEVISNTEISISGVSKELVGEYAANIRKVREPEPYKGKGIRYKDEYIRRKEGKKAA